MHVYFNLPANEIICNGKQITFQAPYDCSSIDKITLIASNGTSETERKNFVLCDSLGNSLVGKTGYFTANSYVSVLLDKDNGKAYLQTFAKSIQDSSSAGTLSSSRTGLCTERDIYYGLPTINGSHSYTSNTNIYAPTSVGTKGYVLVSNGSGAPSWNAVSALSSTTSSVTLSNTSVYIYSHGDGAKYTGSWVPLGGSYTLYLTKTGKVVTIQGLISAKTAPKDCEYTSVFANTIPAGFRPPVNTYIGFDYGAQTINGKAAMGSMYGKAGFSLMIAPDGTLSSKMGWSSNIGANTIMSNLTCNASYVCS